MGFCCICTASRGIEYVPRSENMSNVPLHRAASSRLFPPHAPKCVSQVLFHPPRNSAGCPRLAETPAEKKKKKNVQRPSLFVQTLSHAAAACWVSLVCSYHAVVSLTKEYGPPRPARLVIKRALASSCLIGRSLTEITPEEEPVLLVHGRRARSHRCTLLRLGSSAVQRPMAWSEALSSA